MSNAWSEVLGNVRYYGKAKIPIPYLIPVGPIVFSGIVYVDTANLEDTYSDGVITGIAVPTNYHIDKDHTEVWANFGTVKVGLKLDIKKKGLSVRECHYVVEGSPVPYPHWKCSDWIMVLNW